MAEAPERTDSHPPDVGSGARASRRNGAEETRCAASLLVGFESAHAASLALESEQVRADAAMMDALSGKSTASR